MSGKEKRMFELEIKQRREGSLYLSESHKYFSKDLEKLFDLIDLSIKLSRNEIEYTIREIEEGQVEDNED